MRTIVTLCFLLALTGIAHAQQPVNANMRCFNTATNANVPCPMSDGGSGAVTGNTVRTTMGGEPCSGTKVAAPFSISSATTTQLVAASGGNKLYVCSINIGPIGNTANNVALVEDDTSNCASPSAGMAGGTTAASGWNIAANGGLGFGGSNASIAVTVATNRYVCLITSSASQTSGVMMYVLAP